MKFVNIIGAILAASTLVACGDKTPPGFDNHVNNQVQPNTTQPVVVQQQSDNGPGWGGVMAAGAIGYMLGSSNNQSSNTHTNHTREVIREVPSNRSYNNVPTNKTVIGSAVKPPIPSAPPVPKFVAPTPPKPQIVTPTSKPNYSSGNFKSYGSSTYSKPSYSGSAFSGSRRR